MKSIYLVVLQIVLIMPCSKGFGQQTGSPEDLLKNSQMDTSRVKLLIQLAGNYYFLKPDSCLVLAKEAIDLSRKLNFRSGELQALNMAGESFRFLGDFPQALEMQFKALQINRASHDRNGEAGTLGFIGLTYVELNEFRQGLANLYQAKEIFNTLSNPVMSTFNLSNIGVCL